MDEKKIREKFSDMAIVLSIKEPASKAFYEMYIEILQYLYSVDGLYIILSKDYIDEIRGISLPLAVQKDKFPAIYVFTDYELALNWCNHYEYFYADGKAPIGYIPKNQMDFMYVFQIAFQFGIFKCFINEGDRMLCFNTADMIKVNNMDQSLMAIKVEEMEKKLAKNEMPKPIVRFNPIDIIGFEKTEENTQYAKDVIDKMFDEFDCSVQALYQAECVKRGKTAKNFGDKMITIFFKDNAEVVRAINDNALMNIEQNFFEIVEKYDEKKLFNDRYSYLMFESKEKYPDIEEYFK